MSSPFDLTSIDADQVGKLARVLSCTDIEECEIEQAGCRLWLRRTLRDAASAGGIQPAASPVRDQPSDEPELILAPAVGVFHRSDRRTPLAKVEVGARVKSGDVLGFIEVMTIPHGVFSTRDGTVESFLVEDGQPVEYGQPLVAIIH